MLIRPSIASVLIGLAPASCGNHSDPGGDRKPFGEWTRCPANSGFTEHGWSMNERISREVLDYEYDHNCTFPFTGDRPYMVVLFHDHPSAD